MVTVVLPAFNEARALPALLRRLAELHDQMPEMRVVLVDDGSTDGTASVPSPYPFVHCVRHAQNLGLGRAIVSGLGQALATRADIIVTMDADDSHDPALLPHLVAALQGGCDIAIASRYSAGAGQRGVPLWRRLGSFIVNGCLRLVLRSDVSDHTSGFRAFRRATIQRLFEANRTRPLMESGFAATLELLLVTVVNGARVCEVPMDLRYDRKPSASAMRTLPTLFATGRVTLRYGWSVTRHNWHRAVR